jgi:1,4-dihydroxy-2-naphthoate octaprenyltransferase
VGSAIALAAYGYLVNDASDVEPDRRAGKANAMARFPVPARLGVIGVFALLGALPWFWIRLEPPALLALAGIYLVPLVYSAPPVRLKERLLGPVADAANAFVLPALFTAALFAPLGRSTGPAPLMVVGAVLWAAGFGLRAIFLHQIADVDNDRASGTTTVVVRIGPERAVRVMRTVLFPVELVGLALLVATVATWSWGTVVAGLGYAALFHGARLTGVVDRGLATTSVERGWWLYWYQIWPALLVSIGLAVWQPWYLGLTGVVLVLFWPRVRSGLGIFRRELLRELRRHRAVRRQRRLPT